MVCLGCEWSRKCAQVVLKFRWSHVLLGNADLPPLQGGSFCFYRPPGVKTPGLVLSPFGTANHQHLSYFRRHPAEPIEDDDEDENDYESRGTRLLALDSSSLLLPRLQPAEE